MSLLQDSLHRYIFKLLGITIKLEKWPQASSLPRFLYDSYDCYCGDFLDVPYLFLLSKNEKEGTPAAIKKHVTLIKGKYSGEVVLVCPLIAQHNRSRLIEYKIPFIIPDNQLYLPASGVALREYFRQPHRETQTFTPSAQVVVLNALINNEYGPTTSAQLVSQLHYSAMTLTRAIDEIETSGLGVVEARGRERILVFAEKKRDLWEKALVYFRSPVKKIIYLHSTNRKMNHPKAGLTALAQQGMIAEPDQEIFALSGEQFKAIETQQDIEIVPHAEPGAVCFEIWRYSPDILGRNNLVDPLSLYLSLKDSNDERVFADVQTLLEDFFDTRN